MECGCRDFEWVRAWLSSVFVSSSSECVSLVILSCLSDLILITGETKELRLWATHVNLGAFIRPVGPQFSSRGKPHIHPFPLSQLDFEDRSFQDIISQLIHFLKKICSSFDWLSFTDSGRVETLLFSKVLHPPSLHLELCLN